MEPQGQRSGLGWQRASLDDLAGEETTAVPLSLGLLNGALLGLALVLGIWGAQAAALLPLPLTFKYHSMALAAGLLILVCALMGWLTAWLNRTAVTALLWLGTAVVLTFLIIYQPNQLSNFAVWLADGRFWGLPIYSFAAPFSGLFLLSAITGGFFLILLLGLLGLFQGARLTGIQQERGENGRLNRRGWALLLLPLPLIVLAGAITANIVADKTWQALPIVHRAVQTARGYPGDLFALGLTEGVNYAALQGLTDQLSGDYRLGLGEVDAQLTTTLVTVNFTEGTWLNCRLINQQLNFCYDAAPPYTLGLTALLFDMAEVPGCPNCLPDVTPEAQSWLAENRDRFDPAPVISRQAQYGGYVLMAIQSADGSAHAECLFDTPNRPRLVRCRVP